MKIKFLVCILVLSLCFPVIANAADSSKMTSSQGFIFQYGSDGGVAFSFSMTVLSNINYEVSTSSGVKSYKLKRSAVTVHTPKSSSNGIVACGTGIAAIKQTKYGSANPPTATWSLPNLSTHIYDSNLYYLYGGYESNYFSNGYVTITSPPTTSGVFQNQGSAITDQSKCIGGGTVLNTWTWSY